LNQGIFRSPVFKSFWNQATFDSFSPPASLLARRASKVS
jgi:hypothetical protein